MNQTLNPPAAKREYTRYVRIGGGEYEVSLRAGTQEEHLYIELKMFTQLDMRGQPCSGWFKQIFSESVYCGDGELAHECIASCFKCQQSRMREWIRSWRMHRESAAAEKGGKRGYYTKHANTCLKMGLEYAAKWKIAKAIWKELVKL